MYKSKRIICVIPARLHSSRFPKKVLKSLGGKPLLQWVYEAARECELFDEIVFAVDARETQDLVESFGARALMTSEECLNGTVRMIEVKQRYQIRGDVWVNWQADEPFIQKPLILDLLQSIDSSSDVWTLRKKITEDQEIHDPSVVKVIVDHEDKALYFSRYSIPYAMKAVEFTRYKHLGIYAFTEEALDKIATLPPADLELSESLEQLRFLYHGMKITVHETHYQTMGIDLQEHLELAEASLTLKHQIV
jgi:3-deoxy-manno-octulosonate cytidylyltransferase (CMP-KDO synthetase)